ncbi:MAG: hypothetical protein V4645_18155 [Pseudomonadota bacterium]
MNLLKSKTVWAGLAGVIAAAGGYYTGDITAGAALNAGLTGVIGVFLRLAVEKNAP